MATHRPVNVAVAVCTYRRNEPLRILLRALEAAAAEVEGRARVGVVLVDDSSEGLARPLAQEFADRFSLGLRYRQSGRANISIARNLALDAALEFADWIAMTDDDCEPVRRWLGAYLDAQEHTGADALTGPCLPRAPENVPAWLLEQPFLEDERFRFPDGALLGVAATNNSILRASFLREHPSIRFKPELGVVGGEDMVWYRSAARAGLRIRFASQAIVFANEPRERLSFGYQLRRRLWLGNSESVTNLQLGDASRLRLRLRGLNALRRAAARPFVRLLHGERPQWRYAAASSARAFGMLLGSVGVQLRHH